MTLFREKIENNCRLMLGHTGGRKFQIGLLYGEACEVIA